MTINSNRVQESEELNTKFDLKSWRREKVWELRAKGYTIEEIVDELKAGHKDIKISHGTVHNDLKAKHQEIKENFQNYIEELPHLHRLAVTGLDQVLYEAWRIFASEHDSRAKLSALDIISDATMKKLAALGDSEAITAAIRTVTQLRKRITEHEPKEVAAA